MYSSGSSSLSHHSRAADNRARALSGIRTHVSRARRSNGDDRWTSAKESSSLSSGGVATSSFSSKKTTKDPTFIHISSADGSDSSESRLRRLKFVTAKKAENREPDSTGMRLSQSCSRSSVGSSSGGSGESSSRPRSGRHWPSEFKVASKQLFPEERISSLAEWKDASQSAGAGLRNLGNSCFMNATLQCLSYTPAFQNYLASKHHSSHCRTSGFCMLCEFHSVMAEMLRKSSVVTPSRVFSNLRRIAKSLRPGRQEDAHEFLRALLDSFQNACLKQHSAEKSKEMRLQETTAVHKIWGGYLRSQVKCCGCGHESNSYEAILDLSLEINDRKCNCVKSALKHFMKREKLDGRNKYRCTDGCKQLCKAYKQFSVFEAPNVLVLHLKRFEFSFGGGSRGKINKHIDFEETLDFSAFMSHDWVETKGVTYQLIGVLVHYGYSAHSGHYISYIRSPDDRWHCMDDSCVRSAPLRKVLSENAYILFYRRLERKTVYKSPRITPQKSSVAGRSSGSSSSSSSKSRGMCEEMSALSLDSSASEACQKQLTQLKSKLESRKRRKSSISKGSSSGGSGSSIGTGTIGSSISLLSTKKPATATTKRGTMERKRSFAEVSRSPALMNVESPSPLSKLAQPQRSPFKKAKLDPIADAAPVLGRALIAQRMKRRIQSATQSTEEETSAVRAFLEIPDTERITLDPQTCHDGSKDPPLVLTLPIPLLSEPSVSSSCQSSSADDDTRSVIAQSPVIDQHSTEELEETKEVDIMIPIKKPPRKRPLPYSVSAMMRKEKVVSVQRGPGVLGLLDDGSSAMTKMSSCSDRRPLFGRIKDKWDDQLDTGEAYTTVRKRGRTEADRWAEIDKLGKVNRFQTSQDAGEKSAMSKASMNKAFGKRYTAKKGGPKNNFYRFNRRSDLHS